MEEKLAFHHAMTTIPFAGRVDLKVRAASVAAPARGCTPTQAARARAAQEPQHRFWVVEVGPPTPSLPSVPRRFYIGRQVGCSERMEPLHRLELRNRRYLGARAAAARRALLAPELTGKRARAFARRPDDDGP